MTRALICAYACAPPGSPSFHGGEELLGWRLVQEMSRRHEIDVLVSAEHQDSIKGRSTDLDARFVFVDLPPLLTGLRNWQGGIQLYAYLWQVRAYRVAKKLHEQRDYELFHHLTYANDWMASHIAALLPIPYVRGPGGGAHRVPDSLLANYSLSFRAAQLARSVGQHLFRMDPLFRHGQERASRLFVCTEESKQALPQRWWSKAELLPVVGLSEDEFPEGVDHEADGFHVISAGKLLPHKGFDLAIRAFSRFRKMTHQGRLTIAGDGPDHSRLRSVSRELGVDEFVRFPGWLPRDEILARMRESDVLLFPSLRDGGGAVVVEAMATGLPVVCLDVGGPGLHVTDEIGFCIEPAEPDRTVHELSSALHRLHESPELRRRMGERARRRAWERYRWKRHGDVLDRAYRTAVENAS